MASKKNTEIQEEEKTTSQSRKNVKTKQVEKKTSKKRPAKVSKQDEALQESMAELISESTAEPEFKDSKRALRVDNEDDLLNHENEEEKKSKHIEIGRRGENAAVRYLEKRGFEILDRNWQCRAGEVDIVARDEEYLVFCEVKTRTNIDHGLPEEAVDAQKRSRYEKIAAWYIKDHDLCEIPIRFDIISLLVVSQNRALVRHLINAFSGAC